ncbi:ATP-dependent DNA helicase [Acidovorax sp. NCPPB 2350]|nr:ATP-dependent DNA helicase [Acidovorax sp. NCPPB 2350]
MSGEVAMGTGEPYPSMLVRAVAAAFAEDGVLVSAQPNFRPRHGQTEMAVAVAETIECGGALVVEAGTGVGKTFSYLVPALLSGERVLISTATKALQDQLFSRDLPRLAQVLALPLRMALLKGRASYLCLHRLALARQHPLAQELAVARLIARVETWSHCTASGDLSELPGLDERSAAVQLFTSTLENCLGSSCPRFRSCHVHIARKEALSADIVVINHHLFFADQAIRGSGMAELLPSVRVVVFDEAHQLNETGVQFLGVQISSAQWLDLARDVLAAGLQSARGLEDWPAIAAALDQAARDWRLAAGMWPAGTRLRWVGEVPERVDPQAWQAGLQRLSSACRQALAALDGVGEVSPDFTRLHERCVRLLERIAMFSDAMEPDAVRWVDIGAHQVRMVQSPLDIAKPMHALWYPGTEGDDLAGEKPPCTESTDDRDLPWQDDEAGGVSCTPPLSARPRGWIFTSATLGDDASLHWFTASCGLEDARVLRVESPFDYAEQAALYVPRHLPSPSDASHGEAVARWAGQAARVLGGRTLVLTTTLKALRAIGETLHACFPEGSGIEVLVQGQWPKRRLMERFREGCDGGGGRGCVLVASASFWEGFDVPGDALQLVVIDKLPFPPPGDPVVEARSRRLEGRGKSAFRHFALPEAAIALKQGAGRLIRSESDRGLLAIADSRLVTMGYGKRLLAALPPMRRIQTEVEWESALQVLVTTSSTRALPWP